MKRGISIITLFLFCAILFVQAQSSNERLQKIKTQAEQYIEQKEITKARSLYANGFTSFLNQEKYEEAVECGLQAARIYVQQQTYKEAFDMFREVNQAIRSAATKTGNPQSALYYELAKERFMLFLKLKNQSQASTQLERLTTLAKQMNTDELNRQTLFMQTAYDYTFGNNTAGDNSLQELINIYKNDKQYDAILNCFKNLINLSEQINSAKLTAHVYENYMIWNDSVSALRSQDEIETLQQKFEEALGEISGKDDKLSYRLFIIMGTCILLAVITILFIILAINQLRLKSNNKNFKKKMQMANENSQLKTQFIHNISSQIQPSLEVFATATEETVVKEAEALKTFIDHVEEISSLDTTLDVPYETETINVKLFCEELISKISPELKPGVTATTDCPKMQIKANKEQLEHILIHLLRNSAIYTEEGSIRLDFKKRSARTHQFVVSDNGPGIPEEMRETLFKPFKQTEDLTKGDGLGLPICSLIATKMNGNITLDTGYHKGCRFILELHS